MEKINNIRIHDKGFKTKRNIGRFVQIDHSIYKASLSLSTKLIYAYLKSYMNIASGRTVISFEKLVKATGYGDRKLRNSINTLESEGIISIQKHYKKLESGVFSCFHAYSFKKDKHFERVTHSFLENELMDNKDKEFIFVLLFYILPNDCIGSVENPAFHRLIMSWIYDQTGSALSLSSTKRRLSSLKEKGIIVDKYSRSFDFPEDSWTGYKFNMSKIMQLSNLS
ncbi:MAG: helix-turn-helix domain-containing protein [Prolixibacteraceae bacterium]|nr:helix-turn-helix domain-containing protein [Prolixibacteraceae bacterium]